MLAGGGAVTNFGTILSHAGSNGIAITGAAAARVINSGAVYASGGTNQIYFDSSGGAYLRNAGGGRIGVPGPYSESTNGVSIAGVSGTVVDLGDITGRTAGIVHAAGGKITASEAGGISGNAYGVEVTGGTAIIVNDGQINTYDSGGPGIAFLNGSGGTVINDGIVLGGNGTAVSFGGGNDLLVDEAHGAFESSSGGTGIVNGGGTNTLDMLTGTNRVIVHGGAGADNLTGGGGNDEFFADGDTTMTGGGGTNEFIFSALGSNTIVDFHASTTKRIVFSNAGFGLDETGAGATPKALPAVQFVADSGGTFTASAQRFAYDKTTGGLFFSITASEHLVASLTCHPSLTATQLFFIS